MDRNGKKPRAAAGPRDAERSDVKAKARAGAEVPGATPRGGAGDRPGRPGTKPKPSKNAP